MVGAALDRGLGGNDRQDGADDEFPILIQPERDDRLNISGVFHGVGRANPEIPVVLDGHTNQGRDRQCG
jgi:hypothetical protein